MKFTRLEQVEHEIKYLGFKVPVDIDDFEFPEGESLDDFTQYNELENILECLIDIDSGYVVGYTPTISINIFDKCVDEGTYVLYDENMNIIDEYEGYVPNILEVNENGYGDYLNFTINEDGSILNWKQHIDYLGNRIFEEWDKNIDD
jgi:hypothetical protein